MSVAHRLATVTLWAIFGGTFTSGTPARAAELFTLGPEQCPRVEELRFRVERATGMPLAQAAPLRVDVLFTAEAGADPGYTARVDVQGDEAHGPPKQRRLTARDCEELGDLVGVAIALALGADTPKQGQPAEPADTTAWPGERTVEPTAVPGGATIPEATADDLRPAPRARAPAALTPALSFWALLDAGSLPDPALGIGVGAELRWRRFGLRALGSLFFDQHVELRGVAAPPPGADLGLALGSLSACAAPRGTLHDRLALGLCAGWELGRLGGVGTGVPAPRRGAETWSAPRVDFSMSWAPAGTRLRLVGLVTAATPLTRGDLFLRDLGSVHRPPSVVGRLALGVDVGFE